jgi:DNA-binding MarR family transcriptional regulator
MSVMSISREERVKRIRDTFLMLVWTAARQFSQELQEFGLTLPQFVAMAILSAHRDPCTMSELTKGTLQDPPTMTGIMDRLVKMKLAQRTRSETDRRVVLVQITPTGTRLLNRIREQALDGVVNDYLTIANSNELADIDRLMEIFEQSLEYVLRVYLKRHHSLGDADLDTEIEKIQLFLKSPTDESEPTGSEEVVSPMVKRTPLLDKERT